MASLVDDTRALSMTAEDADEDFGFVQRDSSVLKKALTGVQTSDNKSTGSDAPEVARASGEGAASTLRSVDIADPSAVDVRVHAPSEDDENRKKGILKGTKVDSEFAGYYDGSTKRTSSVTSTSSDQSGLVKPSSKKSSINSTNSEDQLSDLPKISSKKSTSGMKKMSVSKSLTAGPVSEDLPQVFQVKYLGHQDARGLWGIKHTRRPVDNMVTAAKSLRVGTVLPLVKLVVTKDGVVVLPSTAKTIDDEPRTVYTIDTISYGVQDLVYTRVFSMIIVKDSGANAKEVHPFECHAYVCESRHSARRLTYSLAAAFQEYSKAVNAVGAAVGDNKEKVARIKKRFAIDLRSPDEIEADLEEETEA